jgi:heme/copper-type cytochrome/quinol oxidase subunit 1
VRSAVTRVPFAAPWLLCALGLALFGWLSPPLALPPPRPHVIVYIIKQRFPMSLRLELAFLLIAAIYFVLQSIARLPTRLWLGVAHFGTTLVGVVLIVFPMLITRLAGLTPRGGDISATFALYTSISAAGQLMIAVGVIFFLALLIDAVLRRFSPSQPVPGAR